MEHLSFCRGRRFDTRNEPIKTVSSPRIKPVRESHTSIMRRVLGKPNSVEEETTEESNAGNKEEKTTTDTKSKGSKGKHKLSLGNRNKILPNQLVCFVQRLLYNSNYFIFWFIYFLYYSHSIIILYIIMTDVLVLYVHDMIMNHFYRIIRQ